MTEDIKSCLIKILSKWSEFVLKTRTSVRKSLNSKEKQDLFFWPHWQIFMISLDWTFFFHC